MFAHYFGIMTDRSLQGAAMRRNLVLCCLLLLGAQIAFAQQTIRYPQLLEHEGIRFAAYVNEKTGVPSWIIDPDSLDFTLGTPLHLSTEASVRTAADAFAESTKALFGIDPKQLEGPAISTNGTLWFVTYQQVYDNLRVLGAQQGLTVTREGRLVTYGSRTYPKVQVNTVPALSSTQAMQVATGYARIPDPEVSAKDELVILPVEEEEGYAFSLAWEITVSNLHLKPPLSKTFLVDAHTGKILYERSNIYHGHPNQPGLAQATKTAEPTRQLMATGDAPVLAQTGCEFRTGAMQHKVSGMISLNYYKSPPDSNQALMRELSAPFSYAKFSVKDHSHVPVCTDYADANGNYGAYLPQEGTYTVTFHMATDSTFVYWKSLTPPLDCLEERSFTIDVDGEARLDYGWGWGISGDGGLSSFGLNGVYHARAMKEYFRNTHGTDSPDHAVQVGVQLSQTSNAFFSETSSAISVGGAAAMSNDIIMHEYSHLIVNRLVISADGKNVLKAIWEAASDYFAADVTDDALMGGPTPALGVDPALDAAGGDLENLIRNLDNTCSMAGKCITADPGSERDAYAYQLSMTLSGAIWKLRGQLFYLGSNTASRLFYDALKMNDDPARG